MSLFLKIILFPLSVLYDFITKCRNVGFDIGLLKSYQSPKIFTISIGNLTVGGTVKTPHTEFLVRKLIDFQPVVLSRGYGRKTKGYQVATLGDMPSKIGDEPMQIFEKFFSKIPVVVCEKRAEGVQRIEKEYPNCRLIILDDAFQHRAIKPHFQILLNDFQRPFYKDFLLPAGRLRESRSGAKRADVVIVSKCPTNLQENEKKESINNIAKYAENSSIYFSANRYEAVRGYSSNKILAKKTEILALSAIAQPKQFESKLREDFVVKKHFIFSDHHSFTPKDVEDIISFGGDLPIVTTEKDYTKLKHLLDDITKERFYFLPLVVKIDNELELLSLIKKQISEFYE